MSSGKGSVLNSKNGGKEVFQIILGMDFVCLEYKDSKKVDFVF